MVYHLTTVKHVVIINVVMNVTMILGHVNVVDKKIAMLYLLFRMNVIAMCHVLRRVVAEALVLQELLVVVRDLKEKQVKLVFKV
jgi:hypothetical protein